MEQLLLSRMLDGQPEIFASIQGEGASLGQPSTFVRLAVCNLRCTWCDTAYTWDWSKFERAEHVISRSADEVVDAVAKLAPRRVVITGGEPLLQRRQLLPFATMLKARGYWLEVETNGTVLPTGLEGVIDQFNVSPKLLHSGNEGLARLRPEPLRWFANDARAFFKFVVQGESDLVEIEALCSQYAVPSERVVLMPEGRTADELRERSPWLAEICTQRGYRFSTRLHILIWGDKRGV
ncbi:MAG: 7-carboxy-7-deazaguanine synthase QueE [Anaerolineaceae bacterium]